MLPDRRRWKYSSRIWEIAWTYILYFQNSFFCDSTFNGSNHSFSSSVWHCHVPGDSHPDNSLIIHDFLDDSSRETVGVAGDDGLQGSIRANALLFEKLVVHVQSWSLSSANQLPRFQMPYSCKEVTFLIRSCGKRSAKSIENIRKSPVMGMCRVILYLQMEEARWHPSQERTCGKKSTVMQGSQQRMMTNWKLVSAFQCPIRFWKVSHARTQRPRERSKKILRPRGVLQTSSRFHEMKN